MGDYAQVIDEHVSGGESSPIEKQYLEDLERAKRLSLETYENEQSLRKRLGYDVGPPAAALNGVRARGTNGNTPPRTNYSQVAKANTPTTSAGVEDSRRSDSSIPNNEQKLGRKLSHLDATSSDNKPTFSNSTSSSSTAVTGSRQALDIKPRPRPFSRTVSTSATVDGSIISTPPPVGPSSTSSSPFSTTSTTIQPPPTAFRRQRSLPHRHRHPNHPLQSQGSVYSDQIGSSPNNSSCSPSFTNNNNTSNSNSFNSTNSSSTNNHQQEPSDDLILLASPKVTPKFDKNNALLCDTFYSTPLDSIMSQNSPIDSPIFPSSSSTTAKPLPLPFTSSITKIPSPIFPNNSLNNPNQSTIPGFPPLNLCRFNNNNVGPGVSTFPQQSSFSVPPGSTSSVIGNVLGNISSASSPSPLKVNNGSIPFIQSTTKLQPFARSLSSSSSSSMRGQSPLPSTTPTPPISQSKAILPSASVANSSSSSSSRTSLYQGVFDQLRSISDENEDLIDLGNSDSKNILEYFDPLILREKWKEEEEQRKRRKEQEEAEKERLKQSQNSGTTVTNNEKSSVVDEIYNASIQSCGSAATSGFSYRPGSPGGRRQSSSRRTSEAFSLYPSLEEFQTDRMDDASSFYDAYNPFEYLYAVSCSTPSISSTYDTVGPSQPLHEIGNGSLGFSHFFSQHPTPVLPPLPPALPPRNSMESTGSFSSGGSGSRPPSPTPSTSKQLPDPRIMLRHRSVSYDKAKRLGKLYENIEKLSDLSSRPDSETLAFFEMLRELRLSKRHVDTSSNKGYVKSAILDTNCSTQGLSLRLIVWPETISDDSTTFTCDISTPIEMVIEQSIMELGINGSGRDYILRVKSWNEYLDSNVPLANYQYVRHCIKMDDDIRLVLVSRSFLAMNSYARTPKDDASSVNIAIKDILPQVKTKGITEKELKIALETIDKEADRIKEKVSSYFSKSGSEPGHISSSRFMQPCKAVCVLLGEVVTVEIVRSLDAFVKVCEDWNAKVRSTSPVDKSFDERPRTSVLRDMNSQHSYVEIIPNKREILDKLKESIYSWLDRLIDEIETLVGMYSKSFPVSYAMRNPPVNARMESNKGKPKMGDMIDEFIIGIGAVHRLKPDWLVTYTSFVLTSDMYHGSKLNGKTRTFPIEVTKPENHLFFSTLVFDTWLKFLNIPVCILPREARLVFTLYGNKPKEDNSSEFDIVELGWASIQCFNFKGQLVQGSHMLPFWSTGLAQKRLGPAPNSAFSSDANSPLLTINFTTYGYEVKFPEIPSSVAVPRDFETLDNHTKELLLDLIDDTRFLRGTPDEKEIFWEKRHYLLQFPNAFPKILLTAQLWDWASVAQLYALLEKWTPQDPMDALQFLLPCYPDSHVRELAVKKLKQMPDEEIINLLPQLVEALCYETYDYSPLAEMLLHKSLCCLQISHYLFWILTSQVGLGKWEKEAKSNRIITPIDTEPTFDPKKRRLELMLNSLIVISGEKWKEALFSQHKMLESLADISMDVKKAKDTNRSTVMGNELTRLSANNFMKGKSLPLPISPSSLVSGVDMNNCSYYNSNALPLKLTFRNALPEGGTISTIYKKGDDLRQDMLTIQAIRLIEKWWLKEGLDLRILTFCCVPTGYREGMVEMVNNAETMCKIQSEHGVTGVFRDSAIAEWLAKMNPSTLDYQRALDNFILSCAAYCVVTYVLGICDRHNDNIMLTKKGHLFHIDFGKFLGDAQMFGNFKRDRSPFVLTSEMVYVINDGEKTSHRFHRFVELCCSAFKVIRQNRSALITLFQLVATAGIPGVDVRSVNYIYNALMPESSNVEAAALFTRLIEMSSQNWFTPVNFFLHSLAQLRFTSENIDPTRLSFVPDIYTMEVDGRIEKAILVSFEKKYDPEKYYLFSVKLKRKNQSDWSLIHRTYKEFLELYTKLCLNFPMARTLKPLPKGAGLGRSNVKQVADKRKVYLQCFLESLFSLADEIAHSDLVYTFFHPMLRDEQQHLGDRRSISEAVTSRNSNRIHGQVKLSMTYHRGALLILVLHAVDLACPNSQPPSPYVKMYLQPDTGRVTKRKTRVIRKNQHPSFMENIEYRLPMAIIRQKTLQVSVWHHDTLQENNFLGGVSISLANFPSDKEITETYTLGNITSSA